MAILLKNELSLAKELGATHTLNAKNIDVYWEIRNLIEQDKKSASQEPWEGGVDIAQFTGKMSNLQLCASLCKAKSRAKAYDDLILQKPRKVYTRATI